MLKYYAAILFAFLSPMTVSAEFPLTPRFGHIAPVCRDNVRSIYMLGSDDLLEISGPEITEFPVKPLRIDSDGNVQVPLVGRIHVAGLTVQQAELFLDKALSGYLRDPKIVLNVFEIHSQPVSVLGAVNNPGVHQVQGAKTLLEMLSMAGGIRQDAGYSVHITREVLWGCVPLAGAEIDSSGQFIVADLDLKKILEAKDPALNIQVFPHDVITVPKAEMVYVIGEVRRAGGFLLGERRFMPVLQALALAEGLAPTADAKHAKILRFKSSADQRDELPVDVKALLKAKTSDMQMEAGDILYIPGSAGQKAARRALEAAIQAGTGITIWRLP